MSKYKDAVTGFTEGAKSRPESCTDDHLEYLDNLRERGAVNMSGAQRHLMSAYRDLSTQQAAAIFSYWMKTFGSKSR